MPRQCWTIISQEPLVEFPEDRKQGLHSNNMVKRLLEPRTKLKTFASRAFSVIGPKWWNQLLTMSQAVAI